MWTHDGSIGAYTNEVTIPTSGNVGVIFPSYTDVRAYVNNNEIPIHNFNVNAGDSVKFKLLSHSSSMPIAIKVSYNGEQHDIHVIPSEASASHVHAEKSHKHGADKHNHIYKERNKMDTSSLNLFATPNAGMGGAIGGGLGAGVLGGILGGTLLGGNGLLGNRNGVGDGFVTPTQLQTGLDGVTNTLQNTTMMQTLGDIKGAIPLAEGQIQLALAGAQNDINAQINNATTNILNNQTQVARDIATTTAQIIASENATQDVVQNGFALANLAIANLGTQGLQNSWAITQAINNDGDKTRQLIIAQNDAMLNRQLAVAESALLEQRAINRGTVSEINVTQNVNQNQSQLQQQQQMQTLTSAVSALLAQNQHISQGIVNLGTMTGNTQTAANTRVNS
jgi:hypothetical protein